MDDPREIAESAIEAMHARRAGEFDDPIEPVSIKLTGEAAAHFIAIMRESDQALERDAEAWVGKDPERVAADRRVLSFIRRVLTMADQAQQSEDEEAR